MFFCPSQPSQPIILSCINTLIPYNVKGVKDKKERKTGNYDSNMLLRDSMQAPITPALSNNFDRVMTESLLTKFNEYLRTALFIGCRM